MFKALQERPEALNALLGVHCIISEAVLGAFRPSGLPVVASRQPLSVQAASCESMAAACEAILEAFWSSGLPVVASRQPLQQPGSLL